MEKKQFDPQLRILSLDKDVLTTSNINDNGTDGKGAPARVTYPATVNGVLGQVADQK